MNEVELESIVARLRRLGSDDGRYEVKACARELSKDIWESVSAFANTKGGTLILGLDEKAGFEPVGGFELERVRNEFMTGVGDGGKDGVRLANPPQYAIERVELEGHPLLVIEVEELEASGKPCYIIARGIQGGSYKRVDDADIRLSANELYSLSNSAVVTGSDRAAVPGASAGDLDPSIYTQAFAKAQQLMPRSMRGAEDDETRLRRLGFVNADGTVSKAGLLTAGCYPQQFYPKLLVDVAVHVGEGKGQAPECRFVDRTLCVGVLGDIISDAIAAVSKNLRRSSVVSGAGRLDELEIPVEVIREAVANALIHRDYDSRFDGEAVAVDIYDDRVEVVNPGGLWGKSRDELADGRSMCRNPSLMTLMSITPMPLGAGSPAEGNGTGIPLMVGECLRRGLRQPMFYPSLDHFKVVLWRPASGEGAQAAKTVAGLPMGEGVSLTIEEALGAYGELSTREISEKTKLSPNQVRYRLRKLLGSGAVVATASATSRNRRYRLR